MAAGIAALAAAVYALMWVGYRQHWAWLYRVDWSLLDGARALAIKHPSWLRFAESVSFVLGPGALAVLGISVTVLALVMRQLRAALVLVLACAPGNEFATAAAKALATARGRRPCWSRRPPPLFRPVMRSRRPPGCSRCCRLRCR